MSELTKRQLASKDISSPIPMPMVGGALAAAIISVGVVANIPALVALGILLGAAVHVFAPVMIMASALSAWSRNEAKYICGSSDARYLARKKAELEKSVRDSLPKGFWKELILSGSADIEVPPVAEITRDARAKRHMLWDDPDYGRYLSRKTEQEREMSRALNKTEKKASLSVNGFRAQTSSWTRRTDAAIWLDAVDNALDSMTDLPRQS